MSYDVIVVGGGIIGTASAYYLAKRDFKVVLLDQGALANPEASSCDHARVFRLTHGKDSFYTEIARKAVPMWKEFQAEARDSLIQQHGMLEFSLSGSKHEDRSMKVLQELKVSHQKLKPKQVVERYRMYKQRSFRWALYHTDGGMIFAKKAIEAFIKLADKNGARLEANARVVRVIKNKSGIQGLRDSNGKVWKAKNYLFAAGAWTRGILKDFNIPLTVTRQECLYIRPPQNQGRYRPVHFPVFSTTAKGFHGLPVHIHGFMKIGTHKKGPVVRAPGTLTPDKKFEGKVRGFLKKFIPDLAEFTDMEGKVYLYTHTPDGDFILDRLPGMPNAWVAAGFSGNGPMFAPLVGKTVTALLTGEKPEINLQRFKIDRPRLRRR
ncbi:MAG: FAD-dependent oxidoreductase [Elusimicrobiota bacterium]